MIRIEDAPFDSPDGQRLCQAQRDELDARYGNSDHEPGTPPTASDVSIFLVARDTDSLEGLGCGGLRILDGRSAEIKRMFVSPHARGTGVSTAILRELEVRAVGLGLSVLRLETGSGQPDAMRFYEREGYHRIPNFGSYIGVEASRCYERSLTD